MKNADKPAYPVDKETNDFIDEGFWHLAAYGLTKREAFAMAAMQGILSNPSFHEDLSIMTPNNENPAPIVAEKSIAISDTLLEELENTKEKL